MPKPAPVPENWAELPDEQLLDLRLCDLPVAIAGSVLEGRIAELRSELDARGLHVPLHFYLAEEWFTPDGAASMAVPFYLAHPRLEKLSGRRCSKSRAATTTGACASCATRPATSSTTPTSCAGGGSAAQLFGSSSDTVSRVLHAEALQQELRPAHRSVVRAEPSRRGLRRDVCGVADARQRTGRTATSAGRRPRSSNTWTA